MPRHDPPNRFAQPTTWRDYVLAAVIALILLPGGIALTVGVVATKSDSAAKVDRLERQGVAVEAFLSNYRAGRKLSSTVWLQYEYGGGVHRVKVECDKRRLCDPQYTHTMAVTIDPASPDELVTALGVTDTSTRYLDNWGVLFHAAVVLGFGGVSAFVWWLIYREARASRRRQLQRKS
jgi:hypothetical protein